MKRPIAVLAAATMLVGAAPAAAATLDARVAGRPSLSGTVIRIPVILTPGSQARAGASSPVLVLAAPRAAGTRLLRPERLRLGDLLRATGTRRASGGVVRARRVNVGRRGRAASFGTLTSVLGRARQLATQAAAQAGQVGEIAPGRTILGEKALETRLAYIDLRRDTGLLRDQVGVLRRALAASAAGAAADLAALARRSRQAATRRTAVVGPLARSRDATDAGVTALNAAMDKLDQVIIDIPAEHSGPTMGIQLPIDGVGGITAAIQSVIDLLGRIDVPGTDLA